MASTNGTILMLLFGICFYCCSLLSFVFGETETIPNGDIAEITKSEEPEDIQVLVDDAKDYAHYQGLIFRENRESSDIARFSPFTLFPTPVPKKQFHQAVAVEDAMTLLYFRISRDYKFLVKILGEMAKTDKIIGALMDILHEVQEEGIRQPLTMVVQRADYFFHEKPEGGNNGDKYELKQIEVNSGAIAGTFVQHLTDLHRRTLKWASMDASEARLPVNNAISTIADGLYQAWLAYKNPDAILLMLTSPRGSPTRFDQRYIEYELDRISEGKLVTVIMNIKESGRLTLGNDFELLLDHREVAVVYFRVSFLQEFEYLEPYLPARKLIEHSKAIKCPSIGMSLASTKKIQQVLAQPQMVELFFPGSENKPTVDAIRATFAGLWALEEDNRDIIQDAIDHPEGYVLKPNRECGGHNIWGQEITEKLKTMKPDERKDYILMQRLHPMATKNYFVHPGSEPKLVSVVVELGVFGCLVGNLEDGTTSYNRGHGHLMRTKWATAQEGGVIEGSGALDSPYLF